MSDLMTAPLSTRFDHLFKVISGRKFLQMQGLGNEVPFFICPFAPRETIAMMKIVENLRTRLAQKGVRVLSIHLYDLIIELLRKGETWEPLLEQEADLGRSEVLELLQSVLDPETHLIPAVEEQLNVGDYDVLFLTGIGEVYPYLRAHTILSNLQSKVKDLPTVLFYPGEYAFTPEKGTRLRLFGRLHDSNYYRAFNLYDIQP